MKTELEQCATFTTEEADMAPVAYVKLKTIKNTVIVYTLVTSLDKQYLHRQRGK